MVRSPQMEESRNVPPTASFDEVGEPMLTPPPPPGGKPPSDDDKLKEEYIGIMRDLLLKTKDIKGVTKEVAEDAAKMMFARIRPEHQQFFGQPYIEDGMVAALHIHPPSGDVFFSCSKVLHNEDAVDLDVSVADYLFKQQFGRAHTALQRLGWHLDTPTDTTTEIHGHYAGEGYPIRLTLEKEDQNWILTLYAQDTAAHEEIFDFEIYRNDIHKICSDLPSPLWAWRLVSEKMGVDSVFAPGECENLVDEDYNAVVDAMEAAGWDVVPIPADYTSIFTVLVEEPAYFGIKTCGDEMAVLAVSPLPGGGYRWTVEIREAVKRSSVSKDVSTLAELPAPSVFVSSFNGAVPL